MAVNALFDDMTLQAGLLAVSDDGNEYSLRCKELLNVPRGGMSRTLFLPPVYNEPPADAEPGTHWPTPYLKEIGIDFFDRIHGRSRSLIDPALMLSVQRKMYEVFPDWDDTKEHVILTAQRLEPMQLHFDDVKRERVNAINRPLLNKELAEVYKLKALCGGHPLLFTLRPVEVDEGAEAAVAQAQATFGGTKKRELAALASHNPPGRRRVEDSKWGYEPVQRYEESKLGNGFQNQSLTAHQQDALRASRRRTHVDQANNAAFARGRAGAIALDSEEALEIFEYVYLAGVTPV
jgi:hypothetical protein